MSKGVDVTSWLTEYRKGAIDAANNKSVRKWSTSKYSDYSDMLSKLADVKDVDEELSKIFLDATKGKQVAYSKVYKKEIELQLLNSTKASLRRKFVQTENNAELEATAYRRYAAHEHQQAVNILEKITKLLSSGD